MIILLLQGLLSPPSPPRSRSIWQKLRDGSEHAPCCVESTSQGHQGSTWPSVFLSHLVCELITSLSGDGLIVPPLPIESRARSRSYLEANLRRGELRGCRGIRRPGKSVWYYSTVLVPTQGVKRNAAGPAILAPPTCCGLHRFEHRIPYRLVVPVFGLRIVWKNSRWDRRNLSVCRGWH